jgi:hypothetical protein
MLASERATNQKKKVQYSTKDDPTMPTNGIIQIKKVDEKCIMQKKMKIEPNTTYLQGNGMKMQPRRDIKTIRHPTSLSRSFVPCRSRV